MKLRQQNLFPAPLLFAASLLSGCVAVDIPDRGRAGQVTNPTSLNRQATFAEGMDYLQRARKTLQRRSRNMETFDAVTRLGVGIGVAGAGISASLAKNAADRATRFLTGGATSYMANRNVAPAAITRVYRAGIANLECIRTSALSASSEAALLRSDLTDPQIEADIRAAIAALEKDIQDIQTLDQGQQADELALPVQTALTATAEARAVLRQMRRFLDNDQIGEQVVTGVNGTLQVVNQLALARTPDIDAILQSGSVFGTFLNAGGGWAAQIKAAKDSLSASLQAATQSTQSAFRNPTVPDLRERFIRNQFALRRALNRIPDLTLTPEIERISACRTIVESLAPVVVAPNPVELTAGADPVTLTISGQAPFSARGLPTGMTFDGMSKPPKIKAAADLAPGEYEVEFVDSAGISSGKIKIKVAKPAQADGAGGGGNGAGGGGDDGDGGNGEGDGTTNPPAQGGPAPTPGSVGPDPGEDDR